MFYRCRCFITHNIFIKRFKCHFKFFNEAQFFTDYDTLLSKKGCNTAEERELLLQENKAEVCRRQQLEHDSLKRKESIRQLYRPLHPEIYTLQVEYFHPSFLKIFDILSSSQDIEQLFPLVNPISKEKRVYMLPVFNQEFCEKLLTELDNFELSDIPKGQPNSMNKYGVLLDELGFQEKFLDPLRIKYLNPLCRLLYPEWCGDDLDSHRAFTVSYKLGQDVDLDYHYDNCEVTLNVCLGKNFSDGELYFGNMRTERSTEMLHIGIAHVVGCGILHRGQHMHGSFPITDGERHNLILWMRSSSIRNKNCPMCDKSPDLEPASDYGDGFTFVEENSPSSSDKTKIVDVCNVL